jgi:hypothetical protein
MLPVVGKDLPMKNLMSGFVLLSLGVAVATACGGNSKSFTSDAGGSAGKGGSSGGSGGKGGSAGSESGGSSASGTGGTGGKGGGNTGGSTGKGGSGGKGGSAGSGTGGNGEAGEGATGGVGGSAVGGSGGMAGVGAMTGYRPPASQVDACARLCAAGTELMCENAVSEEQCVSDCRFGIRLEVCSAQWDALFECTDDSEPECDGNGEVAWPDCVAEYADVISCAYGDAMDPDLDAPCEAFCEAQDGAMCTNSPTTADCRPQCGLVGAAVPVCKAEYLAYLMCAGGADFMCDAQGDPQPEGCASTSLPFLACVVTEYDIEP